MGRSYDKYNKLKYKNPEVSKMDIIFNEGKINWDSNVYLVEGVFDHISIPNSVPMLGKVLNDVLYKKLIEKSEAKVIIVLDYDAKKDAINLYRRLNSSRLRNRVLIVDMPKGFDIADVQQKLGKLVGVQPGSDMLTAVILARQYNSKLFLIDQEIELTLSKFSKQITVKEKFQFLKDIFSSIFRKKKFEKERFN